MSILGLPLRESLFTQPDSLHRNTVSTEYLPPASNEAVLESCLQLLDQGQDNLRESNISPAWPKWDANGISSAAGALGNPHPSNGHLSLREVTQHGPTTIANLPRERPSADKLAYPQSLVSDNYSRDETSNGRRKSSGNSSTQSDERRCAKIDRQRLLERNRVAANKCRLRKKKQTMQLELSYKEQSEKKEALVAELSILRSEATRLKNELLKHVECGDKSISRHLARSVMSITNNDSSPKVASFVGRTSSSTSSPDTTWPTAMTGSPRLFPNEIPFGQQAGNLLEPKSRHDSLGSMEPMLFNELSFDNSFDDLINL